jgi:hypothetical protein
MPCTNAIVQQILSGNTLTVTLVAKLWEPRRLWQSSKPKEGSPILAVANFNAEQLARAQKIAPIASLQPLYSLLLREKLIDFAGES